MDIKKGLKGMAWSEYQMAKNKCDRLVLCRGDAGFLLNDMKEAERIHESQKYSQA